MTRKYICVAICVLLTCVLVGCGSDVVQETTTAETLTAIATTTDMPTEMPSSTETPTPSPEPSPSPSPAEWPEAYSAILAEYKVIATCIYQDFDSFVEIMASDDYDVYGVWVEQNIPVLREVGLFDWEQGYGSHDDKDNYGYALKDLKGDGSDELIILLDGYTVLAIYSIVDGKPKQVDIFWSRHDCYAIDESGLLYIFSSESAADVWYTIERLSDDGSELLPIERYGLESFDYDTNERYPEPHYYKVTDGKNYSQREIITEAEFDEFYAKHPAFFGDWEKRAEITESVLTFIPILD